MNEEITNKQKIEIMELATRQGHSEFEESYKKMIDLITNYEPKTETNQS